MAATTDRNDPGLKEIHTDGPLAGQQKNYLVLSEEERAKGFVRPVRKSYIHLACGTVTTMGPALAETYARNPKFYGGTFCCHCGTHFPLEYWDKEKDAAVRAFVWEPDGSGVGT